MDNMVLGKNCVIAGLFLYAAFTMSGFYCTSTNVSALVRSLLRIETTYWNNQPKRPTILFALYRSRSPTPYPICISLPSDLRPSTSSPAPFPLFRQAAAVMRISQ